MTTIEKEHRRGLDCRKVSANKEKIQVQKKHYKTLLQNSLTSHHGFQKYMHIYRFIIQKNLTIFLL